MKAAFRLVCSEGVSFLTKEDRSAIAVEAVKWAEKMQLKDDAMILNDSRGLKIVVRWLKREIWVMTEEEARMGGLPSPSDN